MKKIDFALRLRNYLKFIGYYSLGVGFACGIGNYLIDYNRGLGVLIGFAVTYMLHLNIGASLIGGSFRKRVVAMLPVVMVSTALLALKIYVNENNPFGEHPLISQEGRLMNYFLYSIWMTVVLWEIFYIFSERLKTKTT